MPFIVLTGGIASGKSTVAARLADHGAVVIDADAVAREVVAPGSEGLERIAERFGTAVITADGSLDRAALAAVVFADDEARRDLERITHPAVRRRVASLAAEARASDPDAVIVYDVPLYAESAGSGPAGVDRVVVVHAPADLRIRRLVDLRGMDRAQAERRVAAQASDAERLAVADTVIDASGSLAATLGQADDLWDDLTRRSG